MMAPMGGLAQDDVMVVTKGDRNHGPAADVAGETEPPARQASPGNLFVFLLMLYLISFLRIPNSVPLQLIAGFSCSPFERRARTVG